ncbi:MAG: TonB-dependent receptor [Sphingomonas fennica]
MKRMIALACGTALATAFTAAPAMAQDAVSGGNSAGPSTPAPASTAGVEEVVVTAQKRAENVQTVPIAITAFTATALKERAVTSVASLSNIAPNVTFDGGTPFSGSTAVLSAYIRGIGANDFAFNIDPGVGIYLDGVYLARSVGANQDLGDVERIEVLKGPQGTLFGRNTIGGAVSIVTHDPGREFRFIGDVTTGSYRLLQARGTVDLPITQSLSSSVSFSVRDRRGFMKRLPFPGAAPGTYDIEPIQAFKAAGYGGAGDDREGGENAWSGRTKLKWDDGGPLRITLAGDYSKNTSQQIPNKVLATTPNLFGGQFNVFAGTYNCAIAGIAAGNCGGGPPPIAYNARRGGQNSILDLPPIFGVNVDGNPNNNRLPYDNRFIAPGRDTTYATGNNFSRLRTYGGAGTIDYDLSDELSVKSITAYRELHWVAGTDLDNSPLNFLNTSFSMNQKQFSQELQLLGNALDNKLKYVLGAYYFKESGDLHDYVTFAEGLLQVDGPNDLWTKNYAFFGQVDYRFSDFIGVTVGGRYTNEKKRFEGFQSDANGLTYKILNQLGVPPCASLNPISDACRQAAGFPNPGQPLRYYIAGVQRKKFNDFSPKVGVQLYPTDDIMVYGSWSRGYKTGGWTTRLSNPLPFAPDFDEEKAETWEAGVKSKLFDRRLQINAAAFTTRYDGIQLNFQQGVSPVIQNAGDARIKGFEVETVFAPGGGFTLTGAVGHLDAYYTRVDAGAVVPRSLVQAGVGPGITLPKTPKWKTNLSPRFQFDAVGGRMIAVADWTHQTRLKNDTEGTFLLDRKTSNIVDASLTYQAPGDHWSLTAGGTNVFDERFIITGQGQFAGGIVFGSYNRPAEWYLRLGVRF